MIPQEFETLWGKLFKSKCPEDFFGTLSVDPTISVKKVNSITEKAQKVASFKTTGNANAEYRVNLFTSHLLFFQKWARKKIRDETYGDNITYCLKLDLIVSEHEGRKFFLSKSRDREFYFDQISALYFEGHLLCDKLEIKRKSGVARKGSVRYYGTHAAREFFFIEKQKKDEKDMFGELTASMFTVGDAIEIQTTKFMSWHEFYNHILGGYSTFTTVAITKDT